jgi:hypothetical protein
MDTLNAERYVLYIDFLDFIEEKIRKSRNNLDVDDIVYREIGFHLLVFQDVKVLIGLPDGKGGVRPEEFMAEDLSQEDVIGVVRGFEAMAADGGVGAAEVARFPGLVGRAEGVSNVLWELQGWWWCGRPLG